MTQLEQNILNGLQQLMDEPIKLRRVFVDDAINYKDELCSAVVYLTHDQEWESGDELDEYWHIERHASGACGEYYYLIIGNCEYTSDDDTLAELEKIEAHLFDWISGENDDRKVELNQ